jgi:hypothetical protein
MGKGFGGRELCGIDSVKLMSNLMDQIHKMAMVIRGIAIALKPTTAQDLTTDEPDEHGFLAEGKRRNRAGEQY